MNRPSLKLSIYFALGIVLGHLVRFPSHTHFVSCALLFLLILICSLFKKASSKWVHTLFILLVIATSSLHYELRTSHFSPRHLSHLLNGREPMEIEGQIVSSPEAQQERTSFVLRVAKIRPAHLWNEAEGKIRVTVGERTDRFSYGDRLRFRGRLVEPSGARNPGGFDYKGYLNRKGIYGIVFLKKADGVEILQRGGGNPFLSKFIWPIKGSVTQTIDRNLSGPPAALLKGILLGERRNVPGPIEQIFRDSGVIHVLAVSGLHVGLVVFIFFSLFRAFRLPFNGAVAVTLAVIFLYVFVTGSRPPVVRASLMAAVVLIGLALERNVDLLNTVAFAGLVILVVSPQSLFDPGFQLSFAAVLSIAYLYPRLRERLPQPLQRQHTGWRRWLMAGAIVSLSAQLGIAPIVAYYFYSVPVISLVANLIVVPWVGLVLSLGFAASTFGPISAQIALFFNASNWLALSGLIEVVKLLASLPFSTLHVPQPRLLFILGYYCILGLLANVKRVYRARRWLVIAGLVAANLWVWSHALSGDQSKLTVVFLDVGHGDAIFIRSPGGRTMLIDGGRKSRYFDCGERVIRPFLRHSGIRKIDTVLLTHPHSDHLGGLLTVIQNFHIGKVIDCGLNHRSSLYDQYFELIEQKGIPRGVIRAGDTIEGFHPVSLRVLHPTDEYVTPKGWAPYGLNNGSAVLRLDYGRVSFLFLADVETEADQTLLKKKNLLKATVVKVPHQGSITGSSEELVETIHPTIAVILVAEGNRFGHPAAEVVERYERCGAKIYRTDRHGAVIMRTDGESLKIETMLESD
ncbi:MAG: DNA internalization-related competence protein ComEC/Rec2 [bacterium]